MQIGVPAIDEVVCGKADGVDTAGEQYADYYGISVKYFPADWSTYGKAAGPCRNAQMAKYGDALLLVWDGKSRGSLNMKQNMLKLKKPMFEVVLGFNVYNHGDETQKTENEAEWGKN
jgi:hypothetical protein